MPSSPIFGIPDGVPEGELVKLLRNIAEQCSAVLNIPSNFVYSFLVSTCSQEQFRFAEEIHAYPFIYSGPERTEELRLEFAQTFAKCLGRFATANLDGLYGRPKCKVIEVFLETDSPHDWRICVQYERTSNGWEENLGARRPTSLVNE